MRKCICLLLIAVILAGCGAQTPAPEKVSARYEKETLIRLFEGGMDVTGPDSMAVFLSKDIVYYEDRDTYESGRPYGEGEDWERHTFDEAQGHLVLNITAPGAYRISGEWSAGQIRVDLGEDAKEDPSAIPEDPISELMTGVELRQGEEIFFRGGVMRTGGADGYLMLFGEDGSFSGLNVYVGTTNGRVFDSEGNEIR